MAQSAQKMFNAEDGRNKLPTPDLFGIWYLCTQPNLKSFSSGYLGSDFFDMPVESVIADVELSIFHPLDWDGAVIDVEVVLKKVLLTWNFLPVKLLQEQIQ